MRGLGRIVEREGDAVARAHAHPLLEVGDEEAGARERASRRSRPSTAAPARWRGSSSAHRPPRPGRRRRTSPAARARVSSVSRQSRAAKVSSPSATFGPAPGRRLSTRVTFIGSRACNGPRRQDGPASRPPASASRNAGRRGRARRSGSRRSTMSCVDDRQAWAKDELVAGEVAVRRDDVDVQPQPAERRIGLVRQHHPGKAGALRLDAQMPGGLVAEHQRDRRAAARARARRPPSARRRRSAPRARQRRPRGPSGSGRRASAPGRTAPGASGSRRPPRRRGRRLPRSRPAPCRAAARG